MEIRIVQSMNRDEWDREISRFDNNLLFNNSYWLSFLEESQHQSVVRFKIVENGTVRGYLAGMLVSKLGVRIFGSPLSIWFTDSMGPVVNDDFDQSTFLRCFDQLRRDMKIHSLEISSPCLDHDIMKKNGFRCHKKTVYEIPLSMSQKTMWQNLSGKCRNRIRKGLKNGLVVEQSDDPAFVDEFYDQLCEVFSKQGRMPIYSRHIMRSLYKNLMGSNSLFALRVKHENQTIAAGLFPHDKRFLLSFGIASRSHYQYLCPNELMYWTVMSMAGKMGLDTFRIGSIYRKPQSGGIFKKKFNGREVTIKRYSKDYSLSARLGRKLYRPIYYLGKNIKNRMEPA